MAAVRLTVGAASDGSMRTVFKPLVEAAREAAGQVKAIFKGMGSGSGDVFKDVPGAAAKATAVIEREAKRGADAEIREAKRAAQEKARAAEHVFQIKQRYLQQEEREAQRSMSKQAAEQQKHAERTGYWAIRYMDRTMKAAGSFASNMAKSAGVDLDLGKMVGKSVDMGKSAQDLANASYQPGEKGANGQRVAASALIADAQKAGNTAALDPAKALEGMRNFVGTTGDLKTAREVIGDLGILSRATGTDFDDMVTAAGEVAAKLGDIPNKGNAVLAVMRGLAGQGKLGAVEIRNVAKEMANVGASAGAFTGKAEDNMIIIGAMMQEARQKGGAKTASVAANAVSSFTGYVQSTKGMKNLAAGGVQPWADKEHTKLLNPETIILGALMKSNGDMGKLAAMFRDKMSMRAVTGFARTYNEQGGTQEDKLNAVRKEFDRLKGAAMGKGEVSESFDLSMKTSEAQVQLFNNKLAEVGATIAAKLLPQLIALGPTIISGVEAFGKFVAWAVDNPGKAVAAALVASIARAQIDTVVRAGIENLLKGGGGGGGVAGKVGGAAGIISLVGTAVTVAAAAVTIEQVGELVIDKLMKDREKQDDAERDKPFEEYEQNRRSEQLKKGKALDADDAQKLAQEQVNLSGRVDAAKAVPTDTFSFLLEGTSRLITGEGGGASGFKSERDDANNLSQLEARLAEVKAEMAKNSALLAGTLTVHVANQPGTGPAVSPKGRSKQ